MVVGEALVVVGIAVFVVGAAVVVEGVGFQEKLLISPKKLHVSFNPLSSLPRMVRFTK